MSGGFESSPKCRCRHVLRRLRSPAFDRLFSRSGRSASRDKPITRPIPQSARKKTGRVAGCLSLRLASQLQPLGPRLAPESSVAGPARVALAETREFPDSTGRVAVWGADADRSKLRGAKLVVPPVLESPHPRLEPHPSAQLCQRELLTDPCPAPKGEKPAQKKCKI